MNSTLRTESADPRFQLEFLKPRFWGTWGLLLLLRCAMYLPRCRVMAIGAYIGDQFRRRNRKRRRIAEINLELCFPELSGSQRQQLLVDHFRQYGRSLMDMALVLWASPARIDRLCRLDRHDWLRKLTRDNPVIVVAYHLTTLDMSGCILARVHPSVSIMKRDRNPLLTWQLWKGRRHLDKSKVEVLMRDQGLRPLVRSMRSGKACFYIPDEDFGDAKYTVFAPFFGVQTSTLTTPSRLARLTGALIVPSATRLDPETGRYVMTIGDPLKNFPGSDEQADAIALNRAMEALIRQVPDQYMWTFRWFRTQPDGQPSPYDQG